MALSIIIPGLIPGKPANFILISLILFITSCASITGFDNNMPVTPEALSLLSSLENRNNKIKTFKGMGKVVFRDNYNVQISRAAWIAQKNKTQKDKTQKDKIRISLLNPAGQPATSISHDGEYFYAVSLADMRFYKKKTSDPGLQQVIQIPVKTSSILKILSGKIPVNKYYSAHVIQDIDYRILVLKSFWGNIKEKIWFHKLTKQVIKFEIYKTHREIKYQVLFDNYKTISGYTIPFKISFIGKKAQFELEMDRYWADMPVSSSAFILKNPKN